MTAQNTALPSKQSTPVRQLPQNGIDVLTQVPLVLLQASIVQSSLSSHSASVVQCDGAVPHAGSHGQFGEQPGSRSQVQVGGGT